MAALQVVLTFVFKYLIPEYFESRKRAREKKEKFELSQKKWIEIVEKSLIRFRGNLKKDSTDASSVDDQMDRGPR